MKNSLFSIAAALLFASFTGNCANKPSQAMQRIDALIAAGDTVTESGLSNVFVISGASLTPKMLDEGLFTTMDKLSTLGLSDREYCMVRFFNDDQLYALKKSYVNIVFPDAEKFVVDGEPVTRAEFDRIPASLLISVTGEDNGRKLVVETRKDVDDPNPLYQALDKEDGEKFATLPFPEPYPEACDFVIDDFSTYPADSRIYVNELLCSRERAQNLPADEKSTIILYFMSGRPLVYLNPHYFMDPKRADNVIKIPVSEVPSKKLSDVVAKVNGQKCIISLEKDTIYMAPVPDRF